MRVEQIGTATLYLGDALDVLPMLPKVDAVITDPPYGVGLQAKRAKQRGGVVTARGDGYASFDDTEDSVRTLIIPRLEMALSIANRGAVTPGTRCLMFYPRPTDIGCFFSAAGTGMSAWGFTCSQPILYYGKCPFLARGMGARANSCGQTYPNDANEVDHPCAKPLPMMRWLVGRVSWDGETVLDPFMGSGTTGVASLLGNRKFIGIEIEPKYFEIACERITNAQRQSSLLDPEVPSYSQMELT
jgi:site-specific DNA-methyltransferase (adenine-specific)